MRSFEVRAVGGYSAQTAHRRKLALLAARRQASKSSISLSDAQRVRGCASAAFFLSERNHLQCSRAPNLILMKNRARKDSEVTESQESPNCRVERGARRTGLFFMFSCSIFKSGADRGISNLAAVRSRPATFPLLSARAAPMSSWMSESSRHFDF
jgi:hypothetical protein